MGEAGYVVSLFWLSIIIGRVIVGTIAGKVRNIVIMITLAALAIISVSFSIFKSGAYANKRQGICRV